MAGAVRHTACMCAPWQVLIELESWLSIEQMEMGLTQTVFEAVTDTSFLQTPL